MERDKKMVEEAVKRMKMCDLYDEPNDSIVTDFQKKGKVFVSKPAGYVGVLYPLTEAEQKLVDSVEEEMDILVYHVIRNRTEIGVMYSMLYVTKNDEEWEMDEKDLTFNSKVAYPCAYVANVGNVSEDEAELSNDYGEFGSIGIQRAFGGLLRTA